MSECTATNCCKVRFTVATFSLNRFHIDLQHQWHCLLSVWFLCIDYLLFVSVDGFRSIMIFMCVRKNQKCLRMFCAHHQLSQVTWLQKMEYYMPFNLILNGMCAAVNNSIISLSANWSKPSIWHHVLFSLTINNAVIISSVCSTFRRNTGCAACK